MSVTLFYLMVNRSITVSLELADSGIDANSCLDL